MPGNRVLAKASVSIMRAADKVGPADALELRIEEPEIERRIVRDQLVVAEEFQQLVDDLGEARPAGEVCQREAVNARGVFRNVALGVDQSVEMPSGRQVVQQFQRGHLDDPVAKLRFQAGGFRVEQDGAAHLRTSLISRLSAFSDAWRDRPVRITTSARRRFSASGIWRAITAAMSASLIRRRARIRCICTARGAETTTIRSTRWSPPVSSSSGMSSTTARVATPPGARDEGALLLPHHRVQNALQPGQRIRFAQHRVTQRRPVDRAVAHRAGKRRRDRAHRPAATRLQSVHRGVRVEHRDACPAERRGGRRLPHADAAGQAEDDHRVSRSATTNWRSSSSTRGSTPNQAWKPGTA